MMDLDEELSLQIKTVFDHFDDGRSDMGWDMLRAKYPEDSGRKFPYYWLLGAVASLLIVFGLWFFNRPDQQLDDTQPIVKQQTTKPAIEKPAVKSENTTKAIEKTTPDQQLSTKIISKKPIIRAQEQPVLKTNPLVTDKKMNGQQNVVVVNQNPIQLKNDDQKGNRQVSNTPTDQKQVAATKVEDPKINPQLNNAVVKPNLAVTTKIEVPVINQQSTDNKPTVSNPIAQINPNKIDTIKIDEKLVAKNQEKVIDKPIQPKKTTEEFLKEQSKIAAAKIKRAERKDKVHKNSYEVFTGTFLNYYDDNDVKVNAGFGLNANLKLSKSLFLSVGAGVSQNKISYQNYTPISVSRKLQSDYSYAVAPVGTTTNILQTGIVTNIKLNAQLLSLDLPIALKFYPTKKQNFYISTGLNSNSYFAQKYDFTYTVLTASSLSTNSMFDREATEKSKFKGFNLANSAIFAIGINQKIGKTNNLIFEPYFKPVIGYMGDKNLKINTAGLNLKFNFGNTTKKVKDEKN
jgi:hypothetical protein